jgi:hypothetical protein
MTIKPGDILFTGTPEGVIWGQKIPREERQWLVSDLIRAREAIEHTFDNRSAEPCFASTWIGLSPRDGSAEII